MSSADRRDPSNADRTHDDDASTTPTGSGNDAQDEGRHRKPRRPRRGLERLEDRILLSATWVDADTSDPLAGPTAGDDVGTGTSGEDILDGLGGDDQLFGNAGNDTLTGGEGDDTIDGGAGDDTIMAAETTNPTAVALSMDPVAYWSLDGTDPEVGTETVSLQGDATLSADGAGIDFDGTGDAAVIAHDSAMDLDTGTITFRFNTADADDRQGIVSMDASGYTDGGHFTAWVTNGEVEVRLQSDTTSYYVSGGSVTANEWTSVAVNFGTGGLELWVDGSLVDTNSYAGGLDTSSGGTGNAEPLVIGASAWQSGSEASNNLKHHFSGTISDVGFFDSRLDATQIGNLANGTATGSDVIDGGDDVDTVSYDGATGGVTVDLEAGTATGADEDDTITNVENVVGSTHDDTLRGDDGANDIDGGLGDDVVEGRGGADALSGGDGTDTLSYASDTTGVSVDLGAGTASGGDAAGDTFDGFENLTGGTGNDSLTGDTNANVLTGGAGDDVLDGGGGDDTLAGGTGDDVLHAGDATGSSPSALSLEPTGYWSLDSTEPEAGSGAVALHGDAAFNPTGPRYHLRRVGRLRHDSARRRDGDRHGNDRILVRDRRPERTPGPDLQGCKRQPRRRTPLDLGRRW